ncbi:hypothetical protein [Caballeronia temeraria]|nr:hypothetical protein [Caballeronia temeraria]
MMRLDLRTLKISRPVQVLIVAALALAVFAHFRGEQEAPSTQPASTTTSTTTAKPAAPAPASAPPEASAPETVAAAAAPIDLFPSQNWQPPPPPPPPAPPKSTKPPPPPEPPPLPFSVRSLWLDQQGVFYVVLSGTGREFPLCVNCQKKGFLHKGDVILNAYRIDEISRQQVQFTYLPLKRRQTLSLGELK